ncbi:MAG: hypothetical protein DWQ06_09675 [Calditrichaeota bacterium]|nr:MAG: hypothetical protein DWQ06_09675 [Calditrichota bacterium]
MKFFTGILALCLAVLTLSETKATIRIVDNNSFDPANFTTLQAAHDGAVSGDTLYVIGSGANYGNLSATKQLLIFGPGFFLGENPQTQANPVPAKVGSITFNTGSENSLMTGITFENQVTANASNITFKRNRHIFDYDLTSIISIGNNVSNIFIVQSHIWATDVTYDHSSYYSYARCINVGSNCQNIVIKNNYISHNYSNSANHRVIYSPSTSSVDFQNNVVWGKVTIYNSIVYSNIFRFGVFDGGSNDIQYNIGDATQFGTSNGNQENIDMTTVFETSGTSDGKWKLVSGSPAISAGINGADCGMFGGPNPYVLSGIPVIPSIYFFFGSSSGSNSTGLPIQVKIKSHN